MIGKFKNLIGGKSEGFFLELDENDSQSTQEPPKTSPKAEEKQPEPAAATKEEKQPEPAAATKEEKQPESAQVKSAQKSNKTSIKSKKKTATTPTTSSASSNGASSWEPPFWVKAMYNSSSNGSNGQVGGGEQTFATDNLLPTPSTSRRRPGPSLNKFKDMARQAKTPRR